MGIFLGLIVTANKFQEVYGTSGRIPLLVYSSIFVVLACSVCS